MARIWVLKTNKQKKKPYYILKEEQMDLNQQQMQHEKSKIYSELSEKIILKYKKSSEN